MADFFDKLMKDAKKTAAKVADRTVATANIAKNKTLETVDLVKLEIEIKKVQGDLDQEYQVLGQIIYQIEKGVLNRDDQIVQASCNRIDRCKKRLEDLEGKKKGKKVSEEEEHPRAHNTNTAHPQPQEAPFTGYEKDEGGYPMKNFCPHCKAGNPPDAKICVYCHKEL